MLGHRLRTFWGMTCTDLGVKQVKRAGRRRATASISPLTPSSARLTARLVKTTITSYLQGLVKRLRLKV
jgi:hypothetical protein